MINLPKKRLFQILALSIPLLFFIFLELALRVAGYGQSLPLFIDTPDSEHYILARPDIIRRYFPANADIPNVTMEANLFLKHKPANGLRIFVQGGSTAAGFPYGLGASPAGFLDHRLKQSFPDRTVEVINTAMSAVNSYTLLDFADEIIAQQPDAVLIYTGHNEFLGILGVGSNYGAASSHAANLLFLKLRELRIFQLLQNIYSSLSKVETSADNVQDKRTLMSKVAKQKNIPLNSELYQQGLEQFRSNLNLLLARYKEAQIPVLIATISSNLKDQKPFASSEPEPKALTLLRHLSKQAKANNLSNKNLELLESFSLNTMKNNSSELHFKLAKIFQSINAHRTAKNHFILARDNDLLRFRAPTAINDIIKEEAARHAAIVVDYETILSNKSADGLVGNNFMLEHLHPNLQGYFILADSFYQALKKAKLFADWRQLISTNQAWRQRPVIPAEEYNAFATIVQLKSDYPFTDKPEQFRLPQPEDWQQQIGLQYFNKQIDWLTMMNLSYQGYVKRRNIPMLMKTAQIIADSMPQNAEANFRVGKQLLQAKKPQQALIYFKRALLEKPDNSTYQTMFDNTNKILEQSR